MPQVTTEELRAIFSGDATSYQNAVDKVSRSNDKLLESDNKVKNQLGGLARDLMNATSPFEGFASVADRLSETFRVGLGVSVFAVGLKAAAEEAKRTVAEMEKLNSLFDEASQGRGGSASSTAEMAANAERAQRAASQLADETQRLQGIEAQGFWENYFKLVSGQQGVGDTFRVAFGEIETRLQEQQLLLEQIDSLYGEIAKKENKRAELMAIQRQLGDMAGKQAEMLVRQAEELAQAQQRYGAGVAAAIKARHEEEALAFQEANRQRMEALQVEQSILVIKREGMAADIRAAQVRLQAAQNEFSKAPAATDESKAAGNKIIAAKTELENAQRAYALNQSNAILQSKIANLRGSEDDKRLRALELERQFLEWKKNNVARPDDMRAIQADMDRNRAAIESAKEEKRMREIASQATDVETAKGFGPTEELNAMKAKADIAWQLVEAAKEKANFDEQEYKMLVANAKEQDRELQQARVRNQIDNIHNNLMEQEINIQGSSQTEAQKRYSITQAQIIATQAEITALKSLNSELAKAAQLELKQLQTEQRQQQLQYFRMSPRDRAQFRRDQRREQRDNERAQRQFDRNEGMHNVHRDMSGRVISGERTPGGPREQLAQPDTFKDFFDKSEQAKRAAERAEGKKTGDEAFRDQFKTQRQRASDAAKREKEQASKEQNKNRDAAKTSSDPVVKELQDIKTKLDNMVIR